MTVNRIVVSTHWYRRTARAAKRKYERIQMTVGDPLSHPSAIQLAMLQLQALGITSDDQLHVQRCASAARGRWEVVAK